jgi:shikimate kinase/3-dehydroquinate synthase
MGSGKSRVASSIGERCGITVHDLDAIIEARAGQCIPDIFASEGESGFRQREATALRALLSEPGPRVVALGGGALLDPSSRALALSHAFVVTLTASVDTLFERTRGSDRPLLAVPDPRAALAELMAARGDAYRSTHMLVDTDARDIGQVCDDVLAGWRYSRKR